MSGPGEPTKSAKKSGGARKAPVKKAPAKKAVGAKARASDDDARLARLRATAVVFAPVLGELPSGLDKRRAKLQAAFATAKRSEKAAIQAELAIVDAFAADIQNLADKLSQ